MSIQRNSEHDFKLFLFSCTKSLAKSHSHPNIPSSFPLWTYKTINIHLFCFNFFHITFTDKKKQKSETKSKVRGKLFQFQKTLVSTHLITPSNIFCLLYNQLQLGSKKKLSLININIKQMKKYLVNERGKKRSLFTWRFSIDVCEAQSLLRLRYLSDYIARLLDYIWSNIKYEFNTRDEIIKLLSVPLSGASPAIILWDCYVFVRR